MQQHLLTLTKDKNELKKCEGCAKAFYLSGAVETLVNAVKDHFLEQDQYVHELEKRLARLEKEILAYKNEKIEEIFKST